MQAYKGGNDKRERLTETFASSNGSESRKIGGGNKEKSEAPQNTRTTPTKRAIDRFWDLKEGHGSQTNEKGV